MAMLRYAIVFATAFSFVTSDLTGFIEYIPGTLGIILSSPHGGGQTTNEIRDRVRGCYINEMCVYTHDCGVKDETKCKAITVSDTNTQQLTRNLREELYNLTGKYPHVIISDLKRTKLDPNRDKPEAAFGEALAEKAWSEYHGYIDTAKASIKRGVVFDIHGHSRPEAWVMLGYLLTGPMMESGNYTYMDTSIQALVAENGLSKFDEILRGEKSFGGYVEDQGYTSVPSPTHKDPGGKFFFSGGYITRQHGSRTNGEVDAIQIETPIEYRRARLDEYSTNLAKAMDAFYTEYYEDDDDDDSGSPSSVYHLPLIVTSLVFSVCKMGYM